MEYIGNWWRRILWRAKRSAGVKNIPVSPLIWSDAKPQANLSKEILTSFSTADHPKLLVLEREVLVLSRLLPLFPSTLNASDWHALLECPNLKHRLDHLKFLRKCEIEKEKDLREKLRQKKERPVFEPVTSAHISTKDGLFNIHPAVLTSWERNSTWLGQERAFRLNDGPKLVVDCRFLSALSPRGANLTAAQLRYLLSSNRDKHHPWPVYFANWISENQRYSELLQKHLSVLQSPYSIGAVVSSQNYTDLFPQDRIVYLSPHADDELTEVEDDHVYVLGGIVDRVPEKGIHPHASLVTAQQDGVRALRLPLDKYVNWQSGTKYLTLTAVANILYDVHSSRGDWAMAVKQHIPVRNVRPATEKNQMARDLHNRIRELDRQIILAASKELGRGFGVELK